MRTEKEIREKFEMMWKFRDSVEYIKECELRLYLKGMIDTLDWVMNGQLINDKHDKVIK